MNRNEKLIKNSIIYAIGNFASKILNFFLIPIYAVYLSAEDFGNVDLLIIAASLIVPCMTLQSIDGAYRFMLSAKDEDEKAAIFSNCSMIYLTGYALLIPIYLVITTQYHFKTPYLYLLYLFIVFIFQYLQQICRGLKETTTYAAVGFLVTLIQGCSNIIFIVCLNLHSESLLLAPTIASFIGLTVIFYKTKIFRHFHIKMVSWKQIKEILEFSIPLCAHTICWWMITSFGTFFLKYSTGSGTESGIYAMANKFPQLLSMINSIFFLSWQESAVEEYQSSDRNEYFSKIYTIFLQIQVSAIILLLPVINLYFLYIKSTEFHQSVLYVPLLFLANIISAALSFISSVFNVAKNTKSVWKSSLIALFLSATITWVLVPRIQIYGIIAGQVVGYLAMLVLRLGNARQFIKLSINIKTIFILSISIIASFCFYYLIQGKYQWMIAGISILFVFILDYPLIRRLSDLLIKMIVRNKHG